MESMNVAEAKRRFSELLDRVTAGERFEITRRGHASAVLVPPGEVTPKRETGYVGLAAFTGALAEWPDFDELMRQIVADRATEVPEPPPRFDP